MFSSRIMAKFDIGRFWPDGIPVSGVYADHAPQGLSVEGLRKARKGQLEVISAQGLLALIEIASDLAGRPVDVMEIICREDV
jgi:hypothetical protein